jgi:hypothetical protein
VPKIGYRERTCEVPANVKKRPEVESCPGEAGKRIRSGSYLFRIGQKLTELPAVLAIPCSISVLSGRKNSRVFSDGTRKGEIGAAIPENWNGPPVTSGWPTTHPESAASSAMSCLGYNLRALMALAVLVGHAIVKRLSGSNHGSR